MVQVLEPFEVAHCDTACVTEHIGQKLMPLLKHNCLSFQSGWAVSSFHNQFSVELISVIFIDGFLKSGWDEDITKILLLVTLFGK